MTKRLSKPDLIEVANFKSLVAYLGNLGWVQHERPLEVNLGSLDRSRHVCPPPWRPIWAV